MIVFFAPYPLNDESKKGGLSQRVLAIDSLFQNEKRIYVESSFTKNLSSKFIDVDNNVSVYKVNFFIHFFLVLKLINSAKIIYAHTIANAIKFLPFITFEGKGANTICDMHGVLPEECQMNSWHLKRIYYSLIESYVINRIDVVICVTESMLKHYENKYKQRKYMSIILPIFSKDKAKCNAGSINRVFQKKIIYAGGAQIWQNVELMLEHSILNQDCYFEYWMPAKDINILKVQYEDYSNIKFKTGSNIDVLDGYKNFSLGFALRDNDVVNNVACPTKIIEYIDNDIVPILKNEDVGDFRAIGLSYFTVENLSQITEKDILAGLKNNNLILEKFNQVISNGQSALKKIVHLRG